MAEPFFTIGIPTHNRANYLKSAIADALQQTDGDFELLILDNASEDATPKIAGEFSDPRIRYIRQKTNVGPWRNFQDMAQMARGTYLVLHQDDDLIHHHFLARCRAAVEQHGPAVMYAAPMWVGVEGQACTSRLLAPPEANLQSYMAADQVLVYDGTQIAALFLVSVPFNFPAVALHTQTFRNTGGFFSEFSFAGDIVTLGRFATFGRVIYDPRIGGYYRFHETNFTVKTGKLNRVELLRLKYHRLVGFMDAKKIPWEEILRKQLKGFNQNDLIFAFAEVSRYQAPKRLQACLYQAIGESWNKSRSRLWRRLIHRVGWRNMTRFFWNQSFGKDIGPGGTLELSDAAAGERIISD
jgi:glycosyltransferase involved in cell wall biosynthesis